MFVCVYCAIKIKRHVLSINSKLTRFAVCLHAARRFHCKKYRSFTNVTKSRHSYVAVVMPYDFREGSTLC